MHKYLLIVYIHANDPAELSFCVCVMLWNFGFYNLSPWDLEWVTSPVPVGICQYLTWVPEWCTYIHHSTGSIGSNNFAWLL